MARIACAGLAFAAVLRNVLSKLPFGRALCFSFCKKHDCKVTHIIGVLQFGCLVCRLGTAGLCKRINDGL
jgi:hypothetical protein